MPNRTTPSVGALAPELAAGIYGLDILRRDVEDEAHNTTRFVILSRERMEAGPQRTARDHDLYLQSAERARGAFTRRLAASPPTAVNMTKLESYQLEGQFFASMFYADVEGHPEDPAVALALEELAFFCAELTVLGVYRASPFRGQDPGTGKPIARSDPIPIPNAGNRRIQRVHMTETRFDALCIGNAICDVFAHVEEDFLVQEKLVKGSMRLDRHPREAVRLFEKMGQTVRVSGGSAGNTAAGIASLGGKPAYFGKVAEDELGDSYYHDMNGTGVYFNTPRLREWKPTARSMILITPDGERTMNTYLGACTEFSPTDVDEDVVAASAVTYMEGYLWDPEEAKKAFLKAAEVAHLNGRKVALTLSDSFCVDRYRSEFLALITDKVVDLLFANEHELKALFETGDLDTAIAAAAQTSALTALTLGEEGAMAIKGSEIVKVPAVPVDNVVDLTGAGDLFASGFLFGLARDYKLTHAAELGCLCAAQCDRSRRCPSRAAFEERRRPERFRNLRQAAGSVPLSGAKTAWRRCRRQAFHPGKARPETHCLRQVSSGCPRWGRRASLPGPGR